MSTATVVSAPAKWGKVTARGKQLSPVEETLRRRIAERREALPDRPSQSELARRIGVTASAVNQYETGESRPTIDTLVMLAQELHTSASYLVGDTDYPYAPADRGLQIIVRADSEDDKADLVRAIGLYKRLAASSRALAVSLMESLPRRGGGIQRGQ